jgi:serine phosphatase RsbU (regulator of sigma subunit)
MSSESVSVAERSAAGQRSPGGLPSLTDIPAAGAKAWRFLLSWSLGWLLVGFAVALGITFSRSSFADFTPLVICSVLFAEVVGFNALVSARLVFPYYDRFPYALRLGLQVMTLAVGTIAGSLAVLATEWRFLLGKPRLFLVAMIINAVFAVFVGIGLHTYDRMRRQLEAQFRALRVKEALEREIEIAREVQFQLLPRSVPVVRGLELSGVCLPAVGVGGDYYDYLPLPDERIGLVIADVSGKGIPAALLMAGLQASVRSLALPGIPPCEVNRRLNDMLHSTTSDARYATLFFALYDPRDRSLTYSNAGHFPPIHFCSTGAARLSQGGLPIGLMPGSLYGEGRRELGVGDVIALFTDGVIESPDANGEEFGEARLIEVLSRRRGEPLPDIRDAVIDAIRGWTRVGTPHDDITLVLARTR